MGQPEGNQGQWKGSDAEKKLREQNIKQVQQHDQLMKKQQNDVQKQNEKTKTNWKY